MIQQTVAMEQLEQLPIFHGMTPDERQQLIDIASAMEFAPGEVVLQQGRRSQNLLVVLEGRCQVVKEVGGAARHSFVLAELGPHDHFGEMSFFKAAPHSASVRALTELKLFRIERKDYDVLLNSSSLAAYKLAYNILDELADRLRRMDALVSDLMLDEQQASRVSEWSSFREKLFKGWNL